MYKQKYQTLDAVKITPSCLDFKIEVIFENQKYEANCSIFELNTHDKFRCRINYSDLPPHVFGTYPSENIDKVKNDAKAEFLKLLSGLSKDRRIPKN